MKFSNILKTNLKLLHIGPTYFHKNAFLQKFNHKPVIGSNGYYRIEYVTVFPIGHK